MSKTPSSLLTSTAFPSSHHPHRTPIKFTILLRTSHGRCGRQRAVTPNSRIGALKRYSKGVAHYKGAHSESHSCNRAKIRTHADIDISIGISMHRHRHRHRHKHRHRHRHRHRHNRHRHTKPYCITPLAWVGIRCFASGIRIRHQASASASESGIRHHASASGIRIKHHVNQASESSIRITRSIGFLPT